MTEDQFKLLQGPGWKAFADLVARRGRRRFPDPGAALRFPSAYRALCRDLNLARARRYSPALLEDLNRLVWEGHQILYRRRTEGFGAWVTTLASDFPRAFRRFGGLLVLCHVLFYGPALAAFFYAQSSEVRAEALLGEKGVTEMKAMYNPDADHFLRPREVSGDADMFGFYINNNLTIGFRTFAAGALAGVGSLFFVVFNGITLGAAAGVLTAAGFSHTFFPFVVGHGAFELTAILIFAAAGFRLGGALIRPGNRSRTEALRVTGLEVLPLVAGAALFLFLAACLEAFWSSRPLDPWIKYTVGGVLWPLVYGFLLFGGPRDRN